MNCLNFPKMFRGNSTIVDTHENYEKDIGIYNFGVNDVTINWMLK